MNRVLTLSLCFLASLLPLAFTGCSYDGPQYPTTYGPTMTPTFTPVPAVVSYGGSLNFSPAAVTILAGGKVIWDNTFNAPAIHNLYIDNGSGSSCSSSNLSYPATVSFPSIGTYQFHCANHTTCGTSCTGCTGGMSGTVVVQ